MKKTYDKVISAIENSDVECLENIQNFDFNVLDSAGDSILDIALIWGHIDVIDCLKSKSAKTSYEIKIQDKYGKAGILEYLSNQTQNISLNSLKLKLENSQDSFLIRAAREGDFKILVDDILIPNKIRLDFNAVSHKGEKQENLINILSKRDELLDILKPELWSGSIRELQKMILSLDGEDRDIVKDLPILDQTRRYAIKSNKRKIKGFKKI